MPDQERARLARLCRGQAALASTEGVRATLIELAQLYEAEESNGASVVVAVEPLPKQPK